MERVVRVGEKSVGPDHPVFIVAEIGATHRGKLDVALRLIEEASRCQVDAVKLQTIRAEESYVPGELSYEIFKDLWFEKAELKQLKRACEDEGLILFSTPGDFFSLELLLEIGVPLIKISSGLMTNLPLIRRAAATGLPLVISTGMSYLEEVATSVRAAAEAGCRQLMLMHCVSLYPAPANTLNLSAIQTMASAFPCPIGYSDHYDGPAAYLAAVALGARLLEKHFTLDRAAGGPEDHYSADPVQLRELVRQVREVEQMIGTGLKAPASGELPGRDVYRRCLVARRPIAAGQVISREDIGLKRPRKGQQGLPPAMVERVIGQRAAKPITENESITTEMVAASLLDEP